MIFLLSFLIVTLAVFAGPNLLKRHEKGCTALCCTAAFAVVLFRASGIRDQLGGIPALLLDVLLKGGLAGSIFLYVMYAGAVPDGSLLRKRVMPLRRQLSIMGSILALGHGVYYGTTHFVRLFTAADSLRVSTLTASILSLGLLSVLLPLFLTSIPRIRKKMRASSWKKLQRWAYLFYALLYLHILFFHLQGVKERKLTSILTVSIYSLLFFVYLDLRLCRLAVKKKREGLILPIRLGSTALLILLFLLLFAPIGEGGAEAVSDHREQTEAAELPASYEDIQWIDGTYKGAAVGYNGRLKIAITVENGVISDIQLKSHVEDEPYVMRATKGVFAAMIEGNTPEVDIVSSATTTSEALIEAAREALADAS